MVARKGLKGVPWGQWLNQATRLGQVLRRKQMSETESHRYVDVERAQKKWEATSSSWSNMTEKSLWSPRLETGTPTDPVAVDATKSAGVRK